MPQTQSAKKALRVSERRRAINDRWRRLLRATERKFRKSLENQNVAAARTLHTKLQSTLDRMARRRILHRNSTARAKSRLAAKLARLPASPATG